MYDDLLCTVDPLTGSGSVMMNHDYNGQMTSIDTKVTYVAPSTDDELQSILMNSEQCQQEITISYNSCENVTTWMSLIKKSWDVYSFPVITGFVSFEETPVSDPI